MDEYVMHDGRNYRNAPMIILYECHFLCFPLRRKLELFRATCASQALENLDKVHRFLVD